MSSNPNEWELQQLSPGSEILVTDANKHLIARGVLRDDRKGLSGPNGEYFSFDAWQPTWTMKVLRQRRSGGHGVL